MSHQLKIVLACVAVTVSTLAVGCPRGSGGPAELYRVATWAGTVEVPARLVMRQEPEYWNAAWRIEANVRLDEFQDGSLKGTAKGDFFYWSELGSRILSYESIAAGHWDKYTVFEFDLSGNVDEDGYIITVDELPLSLMDPGNPTEIIEFWDFLYPSTIDGAWPNDGSRVMEGESMRIQGKDYAQNAQLSTFREFSVVYRWNIRKL